MSATEGGMPLTYKSYVWPHYPTIYSIEYEKNVAVYDYPYTKAGSELEDMGALPRIIRGSGAFVGKDAYAQMGALASIFYDPGPGMLIHPNWQIANVIFKDLSLKQQPYPEYVEYTFTFVEEAESVEPVSLTYEGDPFAFDDAPPGTIRTSSTERLESIAEQYGLSTGKLARFNTHVVNINRVPPGTLIKVGGE